MPRKLEIEGEAGLRTHIIIYQSDHDFIHRHFGKNPGYSYFIRNVLRTYVNKLRASAEAGAPSSIPNFDGELAEAYELAGWKLWSATPPADGERIEVSADNWPAPQTIVAGETSFMSIEGLRWRPTKEKSNG